MIFSILTIFIQNSSSYQIGPYLLLTRPMKGRIIKTKAIK